MLLFKRLSAIILALLLAAPLLAQSADPSVEVVLSTNQAQKGETIYADVLIHNGQSVHGADVGITTDECLRVIERQPGNYLPSTGEEGGFSPLAELSDHATRFAVAIIDRSRIASGDGVFYRVKLEVICEVATPEVKVTFAQLVSPVDPNDAGGDLRSFKPENGNLSAVSDTLTVQPGAIVAEAVAVPTLIPLADAVAAAATPAISQNTILIAALVVMALCVVGIVALLLVYRRQRVAR
ncbi:MAG: hypothetical protein IT319_12995 [Anaerolineae bacterium]|nr:hypothetical protein [Anaerolineae bacterium]